MVEKAVHTVIISLCRIKTTSRNQHRPLSAHVIPGRMPAVSCLPLLLLHKRKKHGELTVYQVFQSSWNRIIIQRETPDCDIRPEQILNDLCHIILHTALAGGTVPAGKTAKAGADIHLTDRAPSDRRLTVRLLYPSQKSVCQLI